MSFVNAHVNGNQRSSSEMWRTTTRRLKASSSLASESRVSYDSMFTKESSCDSNRQSKVSRTYNAPEFDLRGPPNLTPFSGVFRSNDKSIVRPVAFRPLVNCCRLRTPIIMRNTDPSLSPQETDIDFKSHYGSTVSQSSSLITDDESRSLTYSLDSCVKRTDTPVSYADSGDSTLNLEEIIHSPSPSDSGVEELEAMLRDKDSEINLLRETLEQNEQVIFKVYEEKEQMWLKETRKIRAHYDHKLRAVQQRLVKMEQMRNAQKSQSLVERRRLQDEMETLIQERTLAQEEAKKHHEELDLLRKKCEEVEWTLCQKAGEISFLKSHLKDSKGGQNSRLIELLALKSQVRELRHLVTEREDKIAELQNCLQSSQTEVYRIKKKFEEVLVGAKTQTQCIKEKDEQLNRIEELRRKTETLSSELALTKRKLETTKEGIEEERMQWLEEKEKVIKYQKQLQLNYIQMYRRNKRLESELEKLKSELSGDSSNTRFNRESVC
ncbi:leucine zipper putative tumor suppressor 2 homolog [Limulus polyphemus]|uniref:Leucine zipper putative tumor suppressor 2 homolog n=1 Tax=Limulus polyphemus TaxID=6850 RepID=A0ABM1THI7_LIMPO|nr:leucine zipper putative tumor suppressor 2 homolog [Limulus polyphemus]